MEPKNVYGYWNPGCVTSSSRNAWYASEKGGGDEALHRACMEFEAVFIREILSVSGLGEVFGQLAGLVGEEERAGLFGASGAEVYTEEAMDSISRFLASCGILGLGELLFRNLGGPSAAGTGEPGD